MNALTENQEFLIGIVRQFRGAANFFTQAAKLGATPPYGLDPVKSSLNRWAGELHDIIREISSGGFLDDSHLTAVNVIAQEALSIRRDIGNNALQTLYLSCALSILTGGAGVYSDNDVPAVTDDSIRKTPQAPARQTHRISNAAEKLAA